MGTTPLSQHLHSCNGLSTCARSDKLSPSSEISNAKFSRRRPCAELSSAPQPASWVNTPSSSFSPKICLGRFADSCLCNGQRCMCALGAWRLECSASFHRQSSAIIVQLKTELLPQPENGASFGAPDSSCLRESGRCSKVCEGSTMLLRPPRWLLWPGFLVRPRHLLQ